MQSSLRRSYKIYTIVKHTNQCQFTSCQFHQYLHMSNHHYLYLDCGNSFLKKDSFLLETQRRRGRKIFEPPVHSSNDYNGWSWDNLKPGATGFFWVSHLGAVSSRLWVIFHWSPRPEIKSWMRRWRAETWTGALTGCGWIASGAIMPSLAIAS